MANKLNQILYAFYLLKKCLQNIDHGKTGKDDCFNLRLMSDVVDQEIKAIENDLKELGEENDLQRNS